MRRLHAILIFTYLAACIAAMIGKEVWVHWRQHSKSRKV